MKNLQNQILFGFDFIFYIIFKKQPLANSKKGKLMGWLLYFIGLTSPIIFTYIIFKIKTS